MLSAMRILIGTIVLAATVVARGETQLGSGKTNPLLVEKETTSRLLSSGDENVVTDVEKYPFLVTIWIQKNADPDRPGNWLYKDFIPCGGVLIAPDVVLTAAHCSYTGSEYHDPERNGAYINHGSVTDIGIDGSYANPCRYWINDPMFAINYLSSDFDFALCKLYEPIIYDNNLVTMTLNDDISVPFPTDELWKIGFGSIESDFAGPQTLKEQQIAFVHNDDITCSGFYTGMITERTLCATPVDANPNPYNSFCPNDLGGPLLRRDVVSGKNVYTHVGYTSFGNCPQVGTGVYSRTSSRYDWIKSTVCDTWNSNSAFCESPAPTGFPTKRPTADPTKRPTTDPTERPTTDPTKRPTADPTERPTNSPTRLPTAYPTERPTNSPTRLPTAYPTERPTTDPTERPTNSPTKRPTADPTERPTNSPTERPTNSPTKRPTADPTERPTADPTDRPTNSPTILPTADPTERPTNSPTERPSADPTERPTADPTERPTTYPTKRPTAYPTERPTVDPTERPTPDPTLDPTNNPTTDTTPVPTNTPTKGKKGKKNNNSQTSKSVKQKNNSQTSKSVKQTKTLKSATKSIKGSKLTKRM